MSLYDSYTRQSFDDDKYDEVFGKIMDDLVNKIDTTDISAIPPMMIVLAINKQSQRGTSMTYFSGFPESEKDQEMFFGQMGKSFTDKTGALPFALFLIMEATIDSYRLSTGEENSKEGLVITGLTLDKRVKTGSIHFRRNEDGNYVILEVVTDPDRQQADNNAERWLEYVFAGCAASLAESELPSLLEGLHKAVMKARDEMSQDEHDVSREAASLLARTKHKDFSNN